MGEGDILAENEKLRDEIRADILRSNKDFSERVRREGLSLSYSRESDYLYVTIGSACPTLGISLEDIYDTVLFYDPETFEIRGFEFPFFMERHPKNGEATPWGPFAAILRDHGDNVYIPGLQESERATRAMADFALAV